MNRLRELRIRRGLTLDRLAELAGTSQQQLSRLERGERRLTIDWMVRLAQHLGVPPRELMDDTPAREPGQVPPPDPGDLVPVRSAARGGGEQEMFLEDGPIDRIPRPAALRNVKDAYAIYVVGDSMAPRYRPGTLLHINPFKPARRESGVVVFKRNNAVLIKELVEVTRSHLVLRQFNPPAQIELPLGEVETWHAVVGTEEP